MTEPRTNEVTGTSPQAWKGTILLVGLTALLMLVSGCYTVVATGRTWTDRTISSDRDPSADAAWDSGAYYGVEDPAYASGQGVGLRTEAEESEQSGVGIRYREYYGDQTDDLGYWEDQVPAETMVVTYRRPWIRRLYVNSYYDWTCGFYPQPYRRGSYWNVGWNWRGFWFGYSSGLYWYDPFYWDSFYCDPFWAHGYSAAFGWWDPWYGWGGYDPWRWWWWEPWYQNYWHWNWMNRYAGYYQPVYYGYDPWSPGIAVQDYQRRPADRRRGVTDEERRPARGVLAGETTRGGTGNEGSGLRTPRSTSPTTPTVKTPRSTSPTTPTVKTPRSTSPTTPTVKTPRSTSPTTPTVKTPRTTIPKAPTVRTPRTTAPRTPTVRPPASGGSRPPTSAVRPPKTVKPPGGEIGAVPDPVPDSGRPYLLYDPRTAPRPEQGMVKPGTRLDASRTPRSETPPAPTVRVQVGRPGDYRTSGSGAARTIQQIGQAVSSAVRGSTSGGSRTSQLARGIGAISRVLGGSSSSGSSGSGSTSRARASSGSSSGSGAMTSRPSMGSSGSMSGSSGARPSVGSSAGRVGGGGSSSGARGSSGGGGAPPKGKGKGKG